MPQVLEVNGGTFVIVEDDVRWPGRYDSVGTAQHAAAFPVDDLSRLQCRKNAEAGDARGVITVADLNTLS